MYESISMEMPLIRNTEQASNRIFHLLHQNKIPFYVSWWLAARLYGVDRPLADIDIEVRDDDVHRIASLAHPYITYGPERYIDNEFDLLLMTLSYEGQDIDICWSDTQKIYEKTWARRVDLTRETWPLSYLEYFSHIIPVIPHERLVYYKSLIRRDVDLYDIAQLQTIFS